MNQVIIVNQWLIHFRLKRKLPAVSVMLLAGRNHVILFQGHHIRTGLALPKDPWEELSR